MSWENVVFKPTPLFTAALAQINAGISGGGDIADVMLNTPRIDPNDPTKEYLLPLYGNDSLHSYAVTQYMTVVIHPWVQGVGQGNGYLRSLAPANAVKAAADKLLDSNDILKCKGKLDALVFLFNGASYTALAKQLNDFLRVYSHPELYMCARRCLSIARVESVKGDLPDPAINEHWINAPAMTSGTFTTDVRVLGEALAFADGNRCALESAEDELVKLAARTAELIDPAVIKAVDQMATINGGAGRRMIFKEKTPVQIHRGLMESGAGYDSPYAVCVMFVGPVDSLINFWEMF